MNRNHSLFWFATAMALLGSALVGSAQDVKVDGKAIVRAVRGTGEYSNGDQWLDVKRNQLFPPGTTLRTGPDSYVDLFVNGTSTVRVIEDTTMQLQRMARTSAERGADTETILDLKRGTIIGTVKKLSANSRYEIITPNGTAAIRGPDFQVSVVRDANGAPVVTFSSVTGELVCSAVVDGISVVKVLHTGESWTPGDKGNEHLRPPGSRGVSGTNAPPAPLSAQERQTLQKIASDYNSFGFQLLKATGKSYPRKNIFLSPLGAAFALSIARSGARGATQQEITRALRLEAVPPSGIDKANEKMLDHFSTLAGSLRLEIANGLWTDQKEEIKPDFIANARNFYNGESRSVDLHSPAAIGDINGWVNDRTHGAIPSVIGGLDPYAVMVIVDAVYFKDLWEGPFDKELTQEKPFKLARGGKISHPRMKKSADFDYYETHSFQLVALPYEGSATMFVLLPRGSLERFLQRLTPENWEQWISKLESRKGLVELPRFKLDNDYDFVEPLQALGIRLAFQEKGADFGGIADPPLWISEVEQKTHVDVNEEGTVASAATVIINVTSGIAEPHKEPPPFKMIVDHPFFVVIRENATGAMLFMGAIMDPR